MTPAELAGALKARALSEGADLAGIAPAAALPEAAAYRAWTEAGLHAGMGYLAENAASREDIRNWYSEARSVLMCGYSYADERPEGGGPGEGRVARYARAGDYHPLLKERMAALLAWVKEAAPGADGRVFVDMSPILERAYARHAGLGWVGQNAMLVAPRLGSYFVLAGLALSLELPADDPVPEHCGTCNRCIPACPTDAFPSPRTLDAGRCIAYHTIESRGPVPEDLREGFQDWVFGCDLCQEACPFNRFALPGRVLEPSLPATLPLSELASMGGGEFRRRFGKTSLGRARRRGLARNALLAMGNAGEASARPALEAAAAGPDETLAEQARWSLARLAP